MKFKFFNFFLAGVFFLLFAALDGIWLILVKGEVGNGIADIMGSFAGFFVAIYFLTLFFAFIFKKMKLFESNRKNAAMLSALILYILVWLIPK